MLIMTSQDPSALSISLTKGSNDEEALRGAGCGLETLPFDFSFLFGLGILNLSDVTTNYS
jgi:hypothetical protein